MASQVVKAASGGFQRFEGSSWRAFARGSSLFSCRWSLRLLRRTRRLASVVKRSSEVGAR